MLLEKRNKLELMIAQKHLREEDCDAQKLDEFEEVRFFTKRIHGIFVTLQSFHFILVPLDVFTAAAEALKETGTAMVNGIRWKGQDGQLFSGSYRMNF